jgi:hypothetical protein
MSEMNGHAHPIARTLNYYVLSRAQGNALFAQVLAGQKRIDRLELRLEEEQALTSQALHELARTRKEKEPHTFIHRWLSDHRDLGALEKLDAT